MNNTDVRVVLKTSLFILSLFTLLRPLSFSSSLSSSYFPYSCPHLSSPAFSHSSLSLFYLRSNLLFISSSLLFYVTMSVTSPLTSAQRVLERTTFEVVRERVFF
jgi:hypothetical protein